MSKQMMLGMGFERYSKTTRSGEVSGEDGHRTVVTP